MRGGKRQKKKSEMENILSEKNYRIDIVEVNEAFFSKRLQKMEIIPTIFLPLKALPLYTRHFHQRDSNLLLICNSRFLDYDMQKRMLKY